MAAPALNLDLSGIAIGQPKVPEPIYNALASIQTTLNSLGNVHIAADANIQGSKLLDASVPGAKMLGTLASVATTDLASDQTVSATNFTTAIAAFDTAITVPTTSARVLVILVATIYGAGTATYAQIGIGVDTTTPTRGPVNSFDGALGESNRRSVTVVEDLSGLSAGSHTIKVYGKRVTNNFSIVAGSAGVKESYLKVIVIP